MTHEDLPDVPAFLRLTQEERAAAWANHKQRKAADTANAAAVAEAKDILS